MKIFRKNKLTLKPLMERINGFSVKVGQIRLREDISTPTDSTGDGNIQASDIVNASTGEDSGDTVRVDGSSVDGDASTERPTLSATGCRTNPNNSKSPLDQGKVANKLRSLKSDPMVQKAGGLGKVNIDFNSKTPLPTLESVNRLRNGSVPFSKGELNKLLLNK